MTPDELAVIRATCTECCPESITALADALEAAWAERDVIASWHAARVEEVLRLRERAERAEAKVLRLRAERASWSRVTGAECARAEKAEADLETWRARAERAGVAPPPAETTLELTHDEGTMRKVWDALFRAGLDERGVLGAVNDMQNAGIFFREER